MKKLTAILILLLIIKTINCQTVGLVLSGGGAKGLAHIGVIKALEENNIPIDYISGTSMGAIVGGLYSIGFSPEEMIEIFKSKDFHYWSTGTLSERFKYVFNESIIDASILSFEVNIDSSFLKPVLPSNIIPTNQMDLAFMKIFTAGTAMARNNFDSLFVPFRCVASDIQNKKQIVFKSGDLGEAIRASMTIPLYFKPLILNGKMLFDGGIYNNFPWKELKNDFNPDYIIGSKVANNTKPPKEDDILLQLENMIVGQTDYTIPENVGMIIETKLKDVGVLDFTDIDNIVKAGYENALNYIDSIKKTVHKISDSSLVDNRRIRFKEKLPVLIYKNLNVTGVNEKQKQYILKSIKKKTNDFNIDRVEEEYYRIITDEFINRIYPISKYDTTTRDFDLNVVAEIKKNLDISLGGNISSSSINQGFFSASYSFLGKTANKIYANIYFGRLYSSLDLSFKKKIPWGIPLAITSNLIFNRTDYYRSSNDLFFEDVKPSYLIKNEAFANIEICTPISKNILFSQNVSFGGTIDEYYQKNDFLHTDVPDKTYFTFFNSSTKIEKKTLNKKQYAYRGRNMFIKFNYIYGEEEHVPGSTSIIANPSYKYHSWYNIKLYNESYHKILSDRFWLGALLEFNYSNKPFFSNYTATTLSSNAFNPSPHSKTLYINALHTNQYVAVGLIPNIRLYKEFYLRAEAYIFKPIKEIYRDSTNKPFYYSNLKTLKTFGSLGIITHTPVGPISVCINYYPGEVKSYYLVFNFGFILFNRKGLD